jgi:hypothetical protein
VETDNSREAISSQPAFSDISLGNDTDEDEQHPVLDLRNRIICNPCKIEFSNKQQYKEHFVRSMVSY